MAVLLTNNASSRLAVALTAGATSFSVTSGEGAEFPSLAAGSGNWFPVTLVKASGALEIVRCTARAGDVFTVTRAQEGTSAQAFSVGDRVELRLTKAVIDDILQQLSDLSNAALLDANNLSDVASKPTARTNLGLGTAAVADVVTSNSDRTAGRALIPGSYGIGGNPVQQTGDLNALNYTHFFTTTAATLNVPVGQGTALGQGNGLHIQHENSNYAYQEWNRLDGNQKHFRVKVAGTWFSWVEVLHTGNLAISAYGRTLIDDADAAAARTTLGLGSIATLDSRQACNAWLNFNGVGTVAIRDSYNVSSVTDNGTGNYSINFTTPFANANYSPVVSAKNESTVGAGICSVVPAGTTASVLQILVGNSAGTAADQPRIDVAIFGGK